MRRTPYMYCNVAKLACIKYFADNNSSSFKYNLFSVCISLKVV